VHLLHDLFSPSTVQNILNIHLPQIAAFDKWCWSPSPSGKFSVKSAHDLTVSVEGRVSPFSSEVWLSLWGLKIQARLKHLLWKIAWDILPSRSKIGRFVISAEEDAWVCPFCKGPVETLCHIFLECDLARILWRSSPWPLMTSVYASRPISDWISAIIFPAASLAIPSSEVRKFQLFAALTLDFIWMSRNKLIHEGLIPSPSKAIRQISFVLNSHVAAWRDCALPSIWMPPSAGHFKCNFDVAVRSSFAVAAAVISDESGNIVLAATQRILSLDALQGEARAALLGVRLASSAGLVRLELEGDALLVILAINSPSSFVSWSIDNCIADISLVLNSFHSWKALKVSRCANFRAHVLAKWAATNLVFGSIPIGSPILSSSRIRSGKDPPL
jgi:hypothetical protein